MTGSGYGKLTGNMIDFVGRTEDGKEVARGAAQFRATYGLPFEVIFEILKENNIIPDWLYLLSQISPNKTQELRLAITDTYGREYAEFI